MHTDLFGDVHTGLKCMLSYSGAIEPGTDEYRLYLVAGNERTGAEIEKIDSKWVLDSHETYTNGGREFVRFFVKQSDAGRALARSTNYPHGRLALVMPGRMRKQLRAISRRETALEIAGRTGAEILIATADYGAQWRNQ